MDTQTEHKELPIYEELFFSGASMVLVVGIIMGLLFAIQYIVKVLG